MKKKAIRKCPRIFLTNYFEILDYIQLYFGELGENMGKNSFEGIDFEGQVIKT